MKSRIFKFRIWDKENKFFLEDMNNWGMVFFDSSLKEWHGINMFLSERYIIQQFTGLTDKEGNEIYEGDIVKFKGSHKNYPWRVIWVENDAGFILVDSNNYAYCLKLSEMESLQVTGHINA